MVERQLPKLNVVGSSPIARSRLSGWFADFLNRNVNNSLVNLLSKMGLLVAENDNLQQWVCAA